MMAMHALGMGETAGSSPVKGLGRNTECTRRRSIVEIHYPSGERLWFDSILRQDHMAEWLCDGLQNRVMWVRFPLWS